MFRLVVRVESMLGYLLHVFRLSNQNLLINCYCSQLLVVSWMDNLIFWSAINRQQNNKAAQPAATCRGRIRITCLNLFRTACIVLPWVIVPIKKETQCGLAVCTGQSFRLHTYAIELKNWIPLTINYTSVYVSICLSLKNFLIFMVNDITKFNIKTKINSHSIFSIVL